MSKDIIRDHILYQILNKISVLQHGFCFGKSCTSNLLESLDTIYSILSTEGECDVIYLDFSKAFDSVPHQRLLVKMANMGISDNLINMSTSLVIFLETDKFASRLAVSYLNQKRCCQVYPRALYLGRYCF